MRLLSAISFLAAISAVTACVNRDQIHTHVQQALIFEDRVHAQVGTLTAVFEASVPLLPIEAQAKARKDLAEATHELSQLLEAKDLALKSALDLSAESVDVTQIVNSIVATVSKIVEIVATVGASPLFIEAQRAQARALVR